MPVVYFKSVPPMFEIYFVRVKNNWNWHFSIQLLQVGPVSFNCLLLYWIWKKYIKISNQIRPNNLYLYLRNPKSLLTARKNQGNGWIGGNLVSELKLKLKLKGETVVTMANSIIYLSFFWLNKKYNLGLLSAPSQGFNIQEVVPYECPLRSPYNQSELLKAWSRAGDP